MTSKRRITEALEVKQPDKNAIKVADILGNDRHVLILQIKFAPPPPERAGQANQIAGVSGILRNRIKVRVVSPTLEIDKETNRAITSLIQRRYQMLSSPKIISMTS